MDTMMDMLSRGVEQLLGRASGPLHFRLIMMPSVVTFLAIRAGLRDARKGEPAFLWAVLTDRVERARLLHTAVSDIGRVFLVAIVMDSIYQIVMFHTIYPAQLLIVAVSCAIVPYSVVRGPVTRIARVFMPPRGPSNR